MAADLKVVPIVLRETDGETEVLVFRHPLAGIQIVKGGIEPGETLETATTRELFEESGLKGRVIRGLGAMDLVAADRGGIFSYAKQTIRETVGPIVPMMAVVWI